MSAITAVFSYNRGRLLWNCIASAREYCSNIPLVVFDDGSDDGDTLLTLDTLRKEGVEIITSKGSDEETYGGLYQNMQAALELAHARDYEFVHFLQDDMQFVRTAATLVPEVKSIFLRIDSAAQVQVHFWKRLSVARASYCPDARCYRVGGVGAVGVFHVPRLIGTGFSFPDSERKTTEVADALDLSAFAAESPWVGRVPWPKYSRRRRIQGQDIQTPRRYLLRPLDDHEIKHLASRDPSKDLPIDDLYVEPWDWQCWAPYLYGGTYASWVKSIARVATHERRFTGLRPRRRGSIRP